jgi:hypothetical protein
MPFFLFFALSPPGAIVCDVVTDRQDPTPNAIAAASTTAP